MHITISFMGRGFKLPQSYTTRYLPELLTANLLRAT